MSVDHDVALNTIIKGNHKITQILEEQAQQIGSMKKTLQEILDELRMLAEEREH